MVICYKQLNYQLNAYQLLVLGVHSVNVTQNHQSITIIVDDSYDLLCESVDVDVKSCAFITPYQKTYVLWPGAK